MRRKKNKTSTDKGRHQYPLPGEISPIQRKRNSEAHQQAEKDMISDAELNSKSPNDDLDEGESARLGEDRTDLV
jgi:hypothetical protein